MAPLHELAASADPLRRTRAITAPLFFVRYGSAADIAVGDEIATALAADPDPLVRKAVGILRRHAAAGRSRVSRSTTPR